jgi:hypothetical protein
MLRRMIFDHLIAYGVWSRLVAESWDRWERDEPEWLKKVVPTIPDEYLPAAAAATLGGARERRGSAMASVRESLRVSARESEEE